MIFNGYIYKLYDINTHFYRIDSTNRPLDLVLKMHQVSIKDSKLIKYYNLLNDINIIEMKRIQYECVSDLYALRDDIINDYLSDVKCTNHIKFIHEPIKTINKKRADYSKKNKEIKRQRMNCICGLVITRGHIKRHSLTERHILLAAQNTEERPINFDGQKMTDRIKKTSTNVNCHKCECGSYVLKTNISRHIKTKLHSTRINIINL